MIQCRTSHLDARCRQRGYTLDEVRPCIVSEDGDTITVDETHPSYPREPKPGFVPPPVPPAGGPGTELKAILRDWLGIVASPTCVCNAMARRMDALGPDWCEGDGMPEILAVMRTEHAKRRPRIPWTDLGAKQLVRLACRRARRKTKDGGP